MEWVSNLLAAGIVFQFSLARSVGVAVAVPVIIGIFQFSLARSEQGGRLPHLPDLAHFQFSLARSVKMPSTTCLKHTQLSILSCEIRDMGQSILYSMADHFQFSLARSASWICPQGLQYSVTFNSLLRDQLILSGSS
jgi:hypothetical protein